MAEDDYVQYIIMPMTIVPVQGTTEQEIELLTNFTVTMNCHEGEHGILSLDFNFQNKLYLRLRPGLFPYHGMPKYSDVDDKRRLAKALRALAKKIEAGE